MLIHPEIIVTPDRPVIKFREPREHINLDVELPKILHAQGWGIGTYFHVQFVNHDKTRLLSSAEFVVTEEVESLYTSEANPYQPVTKAVFTRKAERIGEWWTSGNTLETDKIESHMGQSSARTAINEISNDISVVWNPGRKRFQVKTDGKVIHETTDKQEAKDFAAGKMLIPVAA